jgi:hypothetical protein
MFLMEFIVAGWEDGLVGMCEG